MYIFTAFRGGHIVSMQVSKYANIQNLSDSLILLYKRVKILVQNAERATNIVLVLK